MKVCVLGSGSSGNAVWVEGGGDALLVDEGLSLKQLRLRMEMRGLDWGRLRGVCVTHEHSDHIGGLKVLHGKCAEVKFYANGPTARFVAQKLEMEDGPEAWQVVAEPGSPFYVGGLKVTGFRVPHDAVEAWGYVVEYEGARVGIATDLGQPVMPVRAMLKDCDAVVLEANHDPELLREVNRPWGLKRRILGNQGHLSNDMAAAMAAELAGGGRLRRVVLAHLSHDCNREALALEAVREKLQEAGLLERVAVEVARQGEPTAVWEV